MYVNDVRKSRSYQRWEPSEHSSSERLNRSSRSRSKKQRYRHRRSSPERSYRRNRQRSEERRSDRSGHSYYRKRHRQHQRRSDSSDSHHRRYNLNERSSKRRCCSKTCSYDGTYDRQRRNVRSKGTQTDPYYELLGPIANTINNYPPILTRFEDYARQVPYQNLFGVDSPFYRPMDGNSEDNANRTKESETSAQKQLSNSNMGNDGIGFNDDIAIADQDVEPRDMRQLNNVCYVNVQQLQIPPQLEHDVECKEMDMPITSIIKNINNEWHSLCSEYSCKLCKIRFRSQASVISHYVNAHPNNEVFQSRVAPKVAELLRDSKTMHKCEIERRNERCRYSQICYFCNITKCFRKYEWMEHIGQHTGYYRRQCTGCSKKFIKQMKHDCADKCNFKKVTQRGFDEKFGNVDVLAYLCNLCNYVRFDEMEMDNHLTNEHGVDAQDNYKEVEFLQFPDNKKYRTTAEKSNGLRNNEEDDKRLEKDLSIINREVFSQVSSHVDPQIIEQKPTKSIHKKIAEKANATDEISFLIGTDGTSDILNELWSEIEHDWETF